MMKKAFFVAALVGVTLLTGCSRPADVASHNLSRAADNFQVNRRIVFFNGITDKYLMLIEGLCSLGNNDKHRELTVTCKTGHDSYKKHFLGLSDNVSFFAEQIEEQKVSTYHYKVEFRPQTIIPSVSLDIGQ
jgi:hypothetical protein